MVLEVGGGQGVLTERLAEIARVVHVIEIDERLRAGLEEIAARREGVSLTMADAIKVDLGALIQRRPRSWRTFRTPWRPP